MTSIKLRNLKAPHWKKFMTSIIIKKWLDIL